MAWDSRHLHPWIIPFHTIDWLFSTDRKLTQTVDESSHNFKTPATIQQHGVPHCLFVYLLPPSRCCGREWTYVASVLSTTSLSSLRRE
jgi:hypothetical protein